MQMHSFSEFGMEPSADLAAFLQRSRNGMGSLAHPTPRISSQGHRRRPRLRPLGLMSQPELGLATDAPSGLLAPTLPIPPHRPGDLPDTSSHPQTLRHQHQLGGALLAGNSKSARPALFAHADPPVIDRACQLAGLPVLRGTASLPALLPPLRDSFLPHPVESDAWPPRPAVWPAAPCISEEAALEDAETLLEGASRHLPYCALPAEDVRTRQAVANERRLLKRRIAQRIIREARPASPPHAAPAAAPAATCCGRELPGMHGSAPAEIPPASSVTARNVTTFRLPNAVAQELTGLAKAFSELAQTLTPVDLAHDCEYVAWNPRRMPVRPRVCPRPGRIWIKREEPSDRLTFKVRPSLATLAPMGAIREKPLIARYALALSMCHTV